MGKSSVIFGIGCFHFGLKKTYPSGMTGDDYLRELHNALEKISNINNIEIKTVDDFENIKIEPDSDLSIFDDEQNFFPPPSLFLEIYFDIYIPIRLQDELFSGLSGDVGTEKFQVHIKDTYHFPITFIELVDSKNAESPASAVVIVREFLKREFSQKNFEYIQFECLGPSPFHADFSLSANSENETLLDNDFSFTSLGKRGYDSINITYQSKKFSSLQLAKESLFDELRSEVGMFYRIVHHNLLQSREWSKLEELVDNLLETNKKTGIKGFFEKTFTLSNRVQELIIALSEFESGQIWTSFFIKTSYQQLLHNGKNTYLKNFIDEELEQFPNYPVRQIKDIIELIENRRSKTVDNTIVVIAAIIGGIIGSIITLMVAP